MRLQKVNLSYRLYTDSDFKDKAILILASMKNNPAFPTPIPTLAEIADALDAYAEAMVAAENGDRVKVADRKQKRLVLQNLLAQLGMYVMYVANGDDVVLSSSGFTLSKVPARRQLGNPGPVKLTNGKSSGRIIAMVRTVTGAVSYLHQVTTDPLTADSLWQSHAIGRSRYQHTALVPGTKYWFRVVAVGSNGELNYGPAVWQFVQ